MKLFINLTAKAFVTSATDATPLGALVVKQGDIDTLDLVLLEETGTVSAPFNVVDLPAGFTQIRLGARTKANVTETDLLFSATEFVESGTGDSRVFTADLVLDTTPIGDKFTDATTLSLEALLDVELLSADESVKRTVIDQWPTTVNRDIFRDTEGVPASGNPMLRAVWMPDITQLTGGGAECLDSLPTEGGARQLGALVMIPVGNTISFYKLVANEASPYSYPTGMRVMPQDYDADGLNGVWEAQNAASLFGVDGTVMAMAMKDSVDYGIYIDATGNTGGVMIGGTSNNSTTQLIRLDGSGGYTFRVSQANGLTFGFGSNLAKFLTSLLTAERTYSLPDRSGIFGFQGYALFTDTKAAGSNGDAVTTGAWRDVTLNTEAADTLGLFSVSGNVITVAAGAAGQTWEVDFVVPCYNTSSSQVRLYRTSGTPATLLTSSIIYSWNSNYVTSNAIGRGAITFSGGETLKLQVQTQTNGNIGYNSLNTGEAVIFSSIRFRRLA